MSGGVPLSAPDSISLTPSNGEANEKSKSAGRNLCGDSRGILGAGAGRGNASATSGVDAGGRLALPGVVGFRHAVTRLESVRRESEMAREQKSRRVHDDAPAAEAEG